MCDVSRCDQVHVTTIREVENCTGICEPFIAISYSVSGFVDYDIKQLVPVYTTVPVVYGSYTLEYNCTIPRPQCT